MGRERYVVLLEEEERDQLEPTGSRGKEPSAKGCPGLYSAEGECWLGGGASLPVHGLGLLCGHALATAPPGEYHRSGAGSPPPPVCSEAAALGTIP